MIRHIIAMSGGKDSTAMALRLKELNPTTPYEYVITPTGDELPEMVAHWKSLEGVLGPLVVLPNKSLEELISEKNMIPNWRARWCTVQIKVLPFIAFMGSLSPGSIMYVGLRADEETRLGITDDKALYKIEYPMRKWGWGINNVWEYLDTNNITIPERTDCGCCFLQRLAEWRALWVKYPDRYEHYVQIEKKYGHTFRSPGRDTWPAGLYSLRKEFESGRKLRKTKARGEKKCRFCSM